MLPPDIYIDVSNRSCYQSSSFVFAIIYEVFANSNHHGCYTLDAGKLLPGTSGGNLSQPETALK
jgi:hypothetical protein